MKNPKNLFKAALREGRHQIGIWNTIGGNTVAEALAGAGYDWVLIDCEHAPVETADVLPALQAIGQYPDVSAIVRPSSNDAVQFKRILDMGAQTLLVPYVETAAEAEAAISAMRYGPRGIRGMAGMTRATRYGKVDNYFNVAEDELCLIVQLETVRGIDNLEEIAAVDGVDALFIGPADLSASMGLPGETDDPRVIAKVETAIERSQSLGIPCGLMSLKEKQANTYIETGSSFTAVAVDLVLLVEAARSDHRKYRT